jgi:hypothetical protein
VTSRVAPLLCLPALGLALSACGAPAPKPVELGERPRAYAAADYGRVVGRWTRHSSLQKSFDRIAPFDTALDVRATFEGVDWRYAYVERYASYYQLPPEEKDRLRADQLATAGRFHEFHVAATASRYDWVDFLNPKNKMWRVVLFSTGGREAEPVERFPVKMAVAEETAFFPYMGSLDQPFMTRVLFRFPTRFPDGTLTVDPNAPEVTLRFAGPLGTVDLVWKTIHAQP